MLEVSSKARETKARGVNGGFRVEEATGPVPSSYGSLWGAPLALPAGSGRSPGR